MTAYSYFSDNLIKEECMQFVLVFLSLFLLTVMPRSVQGAVQTFDDKAAFLTATAANSASGPLPDLGQVSGDGTTVGTVTFSLAPGGNTLSIGALETPAAPDWYADTPGNDIALGFENLQVQTATPVFALGFDFVEPNLTMPDFGGTPVDSTFEVVLYAGTTEVGRFTFNAVDDELAFVGVWSDVPFDRVTIIDTTGDHDDEFFGEFYTSAVPPPCADAALCQVNNQNVFLAATGATAATGTDANGDPLPLPDLGEVRGEAVTIGDVTLHSPQMFVGTDGDPRVVNGDWSALLPGPDIALAGPGPVKRLVMRFAQPVYAAGFDYVEPQNGPNIGRRFSDATFAVTLRRGREVIAETSFNAPNDVAAFVGLWADVAFDRLELRTFSGAGTKVFNKIYATYVPVFNRRGNILVVDSNAGTNFSGALFEVNRANGSRVVLNDFGDGSQGLPGKFPWRIAVEKSGQILVVARGAGTSERGALFRINPTTQIRTILSDFGNPNQGPLGISPNDVAVEANGTILVVDVHAGTTGVGALFRVNPTTGIRTLLSDFGQRQNQGERPGSVAVEANGNILVVSQGGTNFSDALFRVNRNNGSRTLLSDFGNAGQGLLGRFANSVAVEASGQILVTYINAGTNNRGSLFRVNPTTGFRTLLNDFGSILQGQVLGGPPVDVAVEASGQILVVDSSAGSNNRGSLFRVNPITGFRTLFSDFGDPTLGPLGSVLQGVAVRR
jgi:hypothetical protein